MFVDFETLPFKILLILWTARWTISDSRNSLVTYIKRDISDVTLPAYSYSLV